MLQIYYETVCLCFSMFLRLQKMVHVYILRESLRKGSEIFENEASYIYGVIFCFLYSHCNICS